MARIYPRIKDAYPLAWDGDGVFTDLATFDVPWKATKNAQSLDLLYINHSGEKIQSRIIRTNVNTSGSLDTAERGHIARALYIQYAEKWAKLWDTLTLEYEPIENYRMTETETVEREGTTSGTDTGTLSHQETATDTHTGTDTTTQTGTDTTTHEGTNETTHTGDNTTTHTGTEESNNNKTETHDVYGFDSSNASHADTTETITTDLKTPDLTDTETLNTTDTETLDITDTKTLNLTDSETRNLTDNRQASDTETRNLANSGSHEDSENRTLTRYGNIGVTTSQQMIEAEREVWTWVYFEQVFQDLDNVLALQTY